MSRFRVRTLSNRAGGVASGFGPIDGIPDHGDAGGAFARGLDRYGLSALRGAGAAPTPAHLPAADRPAQLGRPSWMSTGAGRRLTVVRWA